MSSPQITASGSQVKQRSIETKSWGRFRGIPCVGLTSTITWRHPRSRKSGDPLRLDILTLSWIARNASSYCEVCELALRGCEFVSQFANLCRSRTVTTCLRVARDLNDDHGGTKQTINDEHGCFTKLENAMRIANRTPRNTSSQTLAMRARKPRNASSQIANVNNRFTVTLDEVSQSSASVGRCR